MSVEILGIAACSNCNNRFQIKKINEHLVGKSVRCPRCHQSFRVEIEQPTQLESAAINASQTQTTPSGDSEPGTTKRNRRKKSELRIHACKTIRDEMRPLMKRLKAILEDESSKEERVRQWCVDVLRNALGYDICDLDFETDALRGQRIDISVRINGEIAMIIECKRALGKLENAVEQAAMYALNKSVDWAVVTNGQVWKLFRVVPVRGNNPRLVETADISLFDEDGLSDDDVDNLYLLSRRALLRNETTKAYHLKECLSSERFVRAMKSANVLRSLKRFLTSTYKNESGENVRLADVDITDKLDELQLPSSL